MPYYYFIQFTMKSFVAIAVFAAIAIFGMLSSVDAAPPFDLSVLDISLLNDLNLAVDLWTSMMPLEVFLMSHLLNCYRT